MMVSPESALSSLRLSRPRIAPTLALVFAGTATLTTLVTGILVLRSSLNIANQNTALRLKDASQLLVARLDADAIATLRDPSQMRSPAFEQAHAALTSALTEIRGVRFIYTLRKAKEPVKDPFSRYVFVVDGTPYSSKDFADTGVVMTTTSSTDALHRVWRTGRFESDKSFVTDEWGTWMSGYIPLRRRDGSFETVLGIDVSAEQVILERNRILRNLAQAYILSLLLTLPLAALVGGQISEPLRYLQQRLQAIAQLDFSAVQQQRIASGWIQEIHQILSSLATVQTALADFTTYVPTALVRKLVLNSDSLNLRGEIRPLAIMFTDIRNFTGLSEGLDPHQMLLLLNQYFGVIHQEATATGGVLDKYIGDSALLFWGAPESLDHPARACVESALNCRDRLDALNLQWQREGRQISFQTVFGIDFGSVVVGNMGPKERVNYTIVGDRVNLAQRLEYSNRAFGTRILASVDLVQALGADAADYLIVKVADAQLRGFSQPVAVFEVLDRRAGASEDLLMFSDVLNAAHDALRQGLSSDALALLQTLPRSQAERPYVQQLISTCSDLDPGAS